MIKSRTLMLFSDISGPKAQFIDMFSFSCQGHFKGCNKSTSNRNASLRSIIEFRIGDYPLRASLRTNTLVTSK